LAISFLPKLILTIENKKEKENYGTKNYNRIRHFIWKSEWKKPSFEFFTQTHTL
jgi:hypothetical protein